MPLRIDIATLFPQMCEAVMGESITGRARRAGKLEVHCHHIRDYTLNKHRNVDDTPCGHGKGMLMTADPIYRCWEAVCAQAGSRPHTIYMTPKGRLLTQRRAMEIAELGHVCILCGHYEGVDQRLIDEIVDEELSIGDYVLTGGELPALVLADCISRMCEGVLADESCWRDDSHVDGLLEYPHYTRPIEWHGRRVPDILLSGHRAKIDRWRRDRSLEQTLRVRPDLLERAELDDEDRAFLDSLRARDAQTAGEGPQAPPPDAEGERD